MIKGFLNFLINKFTPAPKSDNNSEKNSENKLENNSKNKSDCYNPYRVNEMTGINVHLALDQHKIGGKSVVSGNPPYSYGSADFK
tara:strand:+ start:1982 stop:2236 length:255 start_codon:yes stop_codon:yes gene_type:complete